MLLLSCVLFAVACAQRLELYQPADGAAYVETSLALHFSATLPEDEVDIGAYRICISLDVGPADGAPRGAEGGVLTCASLEALSKEEVLLRELLPGRRSLLLELMRDDATVATAAATFRIGSPESVDITAAVATWDGQTLTDDSLAAATSAEASRRREAYFGAVYETSFWSARGTMRETPRSGPGSTMEATAAIRATLEALAVELELDVLLDVPCGDMHWVREVRLGTTAYVGADIVGSDIVELGSNARFVRVDIVEPGAPALLAGVVGARSLVLCRHLLFHLAPPEALLAIANLGLIGARWVLTSTYLRADDLNDLGRRGFVLASGHRVNLFKAPFCARDPVRLYRDAAEDQYLGLWDLDDGPILGDCAIKEQGS